MARNWRPFCCEGNGVGGWFLSGCVIIAVPRLCFLQAGWMAGGWVWIQSGVGWVDKNSSASLAEHLRTGQGIGKSPTQHKSSHTLSVEQAKEQPGILASSSPVKSSWECVTSAAWGQLFQHWSARSHQTFPPPPREYSHNRCRSGTPVGALDCSNHVHTHIHTPTHLLCELDSHFPQCLPYTLLSRAHFWTGFNCGILQEKAVSKYPCTALCVCICVCIWLVYLIAHRQCARIWLYCNLHLPYTHKKNGQATIGQMQAAFFPSLSS